MQKNLYLMSIFFNDSCHKYDLLILNKMVYKFPIIIIIPKKILDNFFLIKNEEKIYKFKYIFGRQMGLIL